MTDWYLACLQEVEAFLDSFEGKSKRVVAIDSDLVAALVGLLQAGAITSGVVGHIAQAGLLAEQLG